MVVNHILLVISFVFALHHPGFISLCQKEHEFCLGFVTSEKLSQLEFFNMLLSLLVFGLIFQRIAKVFKTGKEETAFISPKIYKEKLRPYLTDKKIFWLNIIDTDQNIAYCKGLLIPVFYISRKLIENLSQNRSI